MSYGDNMRIFTITYNRTIRDIAAGAFVATALSVAMTSQTAFAAECGDIDANGSVTASDALLVLRKAVGVPIEYNCGVVTTTTSTSTTNTGDECLYDADCEAIVGPGWKCGGPNGYTCVECEINSDCQPGYICDNFQCVSFCQ